MFSFECQATLYQVYFDFIGLTFLVKRRENKDYFCEGVEEGISESALLTRNDDLFHDDGETIIYVFRVPLVREI